MKQARKVSVVHHAARSLAPALWQVDWRDVRAVWLRHAGVYRRLWKLQLISPLLEPVFMIFAFGWGIGSLIAARVSGVSYLAFVGAGVLCYAVMARALFEMTYSAYFRMVYQSTFDAILATPVEVESLAFAELVWATTKSLIDGLIIIAILYAFAIPASPLGVAALVPLLLGSFFLAALSLTVTAFVRDIDSYNIYIAAFFSVIFICGIWFPVDVLPPPMQYLAWAIPLTGAVDVTRGLITHQLSARHWYALVYLMVACLVWAEIAVRALRKRMVV